MPKESSCCSPCRLVIAVLLLLVVGGGLTWYLLPEDAKEDLPQVSFPGTGNGGPTQSPTTAISPAPSQPTFSFMQCNDPTSADCCQGLDGGMCDLRVNEIVYGYMHNAVHTVEDGFSFPWNHEFGLEKALQAGFRALELDVGRCGTNNDIVFYHSDCFLGSRDVTETLQSIGQFLDDNPTEIIFLFVQMPSDVSVTLDEFDALLRNVPAVADRLYSHTAADTVDTAQPWPVLRTMIDNDTRAVLFYWNQPSCTEQVCPSGWHYWRQFGIHTDWDFASVAAVDNTAVSCARRYDVPGAAFYRVNAFVQFPANNRDAAEILNTYDYAEQRAAACEDVENQAINFYCVDYWSVGNVPEWIQDTNRARVAAAASGARQ